MRTGRMLCTLLALLLLIPGCTKQAAPTNPTEPVHNPPTPATSTGFWDPDNPKQLPPTAWGKVDPVPTMTNKPAGASEPNPPAKVAKFTLAATLPSNVPSQLPVYMTGIYTGEYHKQVPPPLQYYPQGAIVGGNAPADAPTGPDFAARAASVLNRYNLLMPDSEQPTVRPTPGNGTLVAFYRRLNGILVYGDKPACVYFDSKGTMTWVQIRRRPLLEMSFYPAITPQEAWARLTAGEYIQPSEGTCQDASTQFPSGPVPEFRITSVEIAYWERHVDTPVQAMLPYYVFRSDDNATLYVPAIKPEWVAQPPSPT